MKLHVLDLERAEEYDPEEGSICISINERALSTADVPEDSFSAVLRLVFDDIDRETGAGWILFGEEHARQILDFVEEHRDAPAAMIHCTFGQSRSPAVALGIADVLGLDAGDLERRYPAYNRHIRTVMNGVREQMDPGATHSS